MECKEQIGCYNNEEIFDDSLEGEDDLEDEQIIEARKHINNLLDDAESYDELDDSIFCKGLKKTIGSSNLSDDELDNLINGE